MANDLGARHWLGFKVQTTAGTPETTVDTFLTTTEIELASNPEHIERKSTIGVGRNLPMLPGSLKPSGKATVELAASQPHPFYWALGKVVSTTPTTGVYLHTITEASTGPKRLTVEADRVYDYAKQADAYIKSLKLTAVPGELPTLGIEWLSLSHTDGETEASTPVYVTDLLTCRSVALSIGGTTVTTCDSVEMTYETGIEQYPTLIVDSAGFPAVIRPKEAAKVTGSMKFIDMPTAQLSAFKNATTWALVIELQGDTIAGAYKKFLRVTLPACQFTGGLEPSIGAEAITADASFAAAYDTTSATLIKVEAQNTVSTIS